MSEFNGRWTSIFLIFDVPCLAGAGIFSIPFSNNFFPSAEFIHLDLILIPRFGKFPASPFPVCALRNSLYIYMFFILLTLSCVGVFARANLTFFFHFCIFLGPMVLCLDTLMFQGRFFLLILSYLATKDVPLGRFTLSGTARFPSTIFCFIFAFFIFYRQNLFQYTFCYFTEKWRSSRC